MKEVICGYCEYFKNSREELRGNHYYVTAGICSLTGREVATDQKVCKEFLLMSGVYTTRTIPAYCKHRDYSHNKYGRIYRQMNNK